MSRSGSAPAHAPRDFSEDLSADVSEALAVLEQEQSSLGRAPVDADDHATLARLLTGVRWLVPADGASLYVRRGGLLRLTIAQNDTLSARLGEAEFQRRLVGLLLPVDSTSIAGHVALTGHVVNIPDTEKVPADSPYPFCPAIDRQTYDYCSLLTAPLVNEAGSVVGVVQLVNALEDGVRPVPFGQGAEAIVRQFCAQAASVIDGRSSHRRLPARS